MYSHIVMFCSLVRLPGRRMCAQLIGTFYLITSYVLLSIKISSAVSGEQLASYLLVWTFELDFGSPLGCWARLIYPHHSVLISEPSRHAASKHWRLVSTVLKHWTCEHCHTTNNNKLSEWKPNINERIAVGSTINFVRFSGFIFVLAYKLEPINNNS